MMSSEARDTIPRSYPFFVGESPEQRAKRIVLIYELECDFQSGIVHPDDRERAGKRLTGLILGPCAEQSKR